MAREIETVSPFSLSPNANQDGWLDDDNVDALVAAINAGKTLPPVVAIRETQEIVDGCHRHEAAKLAGVDLRVVFIDRDEYQSLKADGVSDGEFCDALCL